MFAVAISLVDSRGNERVIAFSSDANTEVAALGEAFTWLADGRDAFVVKGWDVAPSEALLLEAIEPHVRAGKKMAAIKALREVKKWDLRKAKAFVDSHWYDWPRDEADLPF
jgi:ribosomal protein L7/L12